MNLTLDRRAVGLPKCGQGRSLEHKGKILGRPESSTRMTGYWALLQLAHWNHKGPARFPSRRLSTRLAQPRHSPWNLFDRKISPCHHLTNLHTPMYHPPSTVPMTIPRCFKPQLIRILTVPHLPLLVRSNESRSSLPSEPQRRVSHSIPSLGTRLTRSLVRVQRPRLWSQGSRRKRNHQGRR